MNPHNQLLTAYKQTAYPLVGHGKRNLHVLKTVLNEMDGDIESDAYGTGAVIENFQKKLADYLGKESAVFFPSGTMAQQIAMRIWCEQKGLNKVAYHPLCHLEIHEEDGLKKLHQIEPVLLADENRLIRLEDVLTMQENIACLLLELPQREIGGELPEYTELEAISAYCRANGIKLHLDGARLFEILPYYQKSAADLCRLFDSVYVSFYKGIGGIAGAILAGEEDFTKEAKVWKRRHGGDLISLYPYIVSADYYFDQRLHSFQQYFEEAKELASLYNQCHAVETRPLVPVSNMFHVHVRLPKEQLEPVLLSIYEETGVGLTTHLKKVDERLCSFEVSIGDQYAQVPKTALRKAFHMLDEKIREIVFREGKD
ncbi:beta-eliminating lyase-related protein [Brevibacillus borstelensis]|uniref:threonine aldolase family protein n=1 Tax=Brevibacillus TaxID=55080 RepID=UPI002E1CE95D|nr:beta-eliminating lyase-related protein [Brevibacillus borstelensis]MED2007262.1 beta-eliminating lyase-related protein [Brevibacillus borstelensis]